MRTPRNPSPADADIEIASLIADTYDDPLGFVILAYPWGEPGELSGFKGPDRWQREFLEDLGCQVRARAFDGVQAVAPIRMATASGHGIGKSTLVAWIVNWIMSTRPNCQGTITANTYTQLETKTWAAIQKWTRMCVTSTWFATTGTRMYHRDYPQTWFCSAQSCREENSEAFAGQHAVSSTSFYLFDEASAIPDKIFEVAEGGLTDGEPMIFLFGNPTRNTGKFYRATYGSEQDRWKVRSIDSRQCALPNQARSRSGFRITVKIPTSSACAFVLRDRTERAEATPLVLESRIKYVNFEGSSAMFLHNDDSRHRHARIVVGYDSVDGSVRDRTSRVCTEARAESQAGVPSDGQGMLSRRFGQPALPIDLNAPGDPSPGLLCIAKGEIVPEKVPVQPAEFIGVHPSQCAKIHEFARTADELGFRLHSTTP